MRDILLASLSVVSAAWASIYRDLARIGEQDDEVHELVRQVESGLKGLSDHLRRSRKGPKNV